MIASRRPDSGSSGEQPSADGPRSSVPSPRDKPIHVVAGVLTDVRGRILLARRTRGRDLAGLWEFPGGKVDPGETPEQALVRELREELGIDAQPRDSVICVPQQYPDKRLRLDVRHVAFTGTLKGLDGQALAWVPPHKLASYPMPPADRPVVAALRQPDRYLVTPNPGSDEAAWLDGLQRALAGGVRRVQLRSTGTKAQRWAALVEQASTLCRDMGAQVLVNGDVPLALALGIGVHLRAVQLASLASRPLPSQLPLAASCHDLAELREAERLGCDFAVVGPLRETESHPGAPGIGWGAFAALREACSLPLYAIGGLTPADIDQARCHGAQGIAAIRGLWAL